MPSADRVLTLYDEIISGGEPLLRQWQTDQIGETSILDFKLASKRCAPLDKSDREHLAEALSGFANSEGGVLVWGVDCKKLNDIDCIQKLVPINMSVAFESSVRSLSAQLCSPGVPGFDVKRIESDEGTGIGYVVCLIPPVDGPPVMALGQDQNCFFYRDVDSFKRMPHWMVERGFNQRPKPKLALVWRRFEDHDTKLGIEFGVRNVGPIIARNVVLRVDTNMAAAKTSPPSYTSFQPAPHLTKLDNQTFLYNSVWTSGVVLPPDYVAPAVRLHGELAEDLTQCVSIDVFIDANESASTEEHLEISYEELLSKPRMYWQEK